jgi:hypothetical protein
VIIPPISTGNSYGHYHHHFPFTPMSSGVGFGGMDTMKHRNPLQAGKELEELAQVAQLLSQLIATIMAMGSGSSSRNGTPDRSGGGAPPAVNPPLQQSTAPPYRQANSSNGVSSQGLFSPSDAASSANAGGYGGSKMGLGISPTSANGNGQNMLGANWYYNWSTNPTPGVNQAFIPTIWGQANMNANDLANVKNSNAPEVFTFNEPEHAGQAQMSVAQAIADWPAIQSAAAGKAIAAPSITNDGDGSGLAWLNQFMQSASASGLKVDALNIHWYGSSNQSDAQNLQSLSQFITTVHDKYPNMPIDLTEFGIDPNGNTAQRDPAFYSAAANMLNGMSFVQMYAPYGLA